MTTTTGLPVYLTGTLGPVPDEIDAAELTVEGAIPPELDGRYVRNGSNPLRGVDPGHYFTGQGMLHGVRLNGGRASWYRNRWVQTPTLQGARGVKPDRTWNLHASVANTSVLRYNDALFALVETAVPYEITPDLETVGPFDFNGRLQTPMTAHPKRDPATGELHFFGYAMRPPFVTYHVASADGRLLRSEPISVTGPTMMHDFAITEHYVVWLDMPAVFDVALAGDYAMPIRWSDDYPPRIGVMPRAGGDAQTRWIGVKPGYAFHVSSAHEDADGRVVLEAVVYDRQGFNTMWARFGGVSVLSEEQARLPLSGGALYRWVLDPAAGLISEAPLDDLAIEFPTANSERLGRENRFTFAVTSPMMTDANGGRIVKYDRGGGERTFHELGAGWVPGEPLFVPARGAMSEDDGFLLSIVVHQTADASRLLVSSASRLSDPPIAVVHLPRRVPEGFHGTWIPER